ncbi:MAG TPA: RES family NAD+ phosphorylase [Thermoanaerobaculia bacterium]|nr:RES family NAD+ phosphorylase [Thermoanaerobaculia bacterium]
MVPDPPRKLAPHVVTWLAERPFHRVFRLEHGATRFNPGSPNGGVRGRFHFFRDANEQIVSSLYGAEVQDAAIAETILQLSPQHRHQRSLRPARFKAFAIASITVAHDLRLIELCGSGLQKLRLLPEELTSTSPSEYSRTIAWAKALHHAAPDAHGLLWVSHQFNTSKVLMLFGDRVDEKNLAAETILHLSVGRGRKLVEHAANRAGITIL